MFKKIFSAISAASFPLCLALVLALGHFQTSAQAVRLRANINPTCTASDQRLKFADIYADGNIAVMGTYGCKGVMIFDITNADNPVLASHYNPSPNQSFLEAIVIGNRGYFGSGGTSPGNGSGGDGVHIVDLTNPAAPVLLGKVTPAIGGGFSNIHEMMVFDQGGQRYLLENSNSTGTVNLRILNITNPALPALKWDFPASNGGWIHAMHIRGNRLFLSGFFNNPRVEIYDIANLGQQTPTYLGQVEVGLGSNHSAWTSEDGNFLYSAREIGNSASANPGDIRVYNVSNPAQPLLVNRVSMADLGLNAVTPHNPVVMNNRLYVSWYQAGMQLFDITTPTEPKRIGQYDTYAAAFTEEQRQAIAERDPRDIVCGLNMSRGTAISGYDGNWAVFPFLGETKVLVADLASGLYIVDVTAAGQPKKNTISDFDGDRKTDFSLYTPTTGVWQTESSLDGSTTYANWGASGDIPVNGDFDGDGKADKVVWRPSTGIWYIYGSATGFSQAEFGVNGDVPAVGDYDADGKTDLAVWRPSNGNWYIRQSRLGYRVQQWGASGDKVVTADFEGDGKADIAVWRPSNGNWYVIPSSSSIPVVLSWGQNGDKPVIADFNGDGRSDYVVYRPSNATWYVRNSSDFSFYSIQFGEAADIPIPADFDGDGKADLSVFRPSTGVWFRIGSAENTFTYRTFGQTGDQPAPVSAQPQ